MKEKDPADDIERVFPEDERAAHKHTESALREREEYYRLLFEATMDAVFVADAETGQLLDANRQAERLIGYSVAELLRMNQSDLHPDPAVYREVFRERVRDGADSPLMGTREVRHRDGAVIPVEISAAMADLGGRRVVVGSFHDLRARIAAEQELRQSRERLAIATQAGGIGVWDRDIVNDVLVWDDRMYELYGVEREQFGGAYETWKQGLHPGDAERAIREVEQAERGDKPFDTEFRVVRPDGKIRHIRASAQVIRDESGAAVRMIGVNYDITARKQADEQMRQSEERFRTLATIAPVGIYVTDSDGNCLYTNPTWCEMAGLQMEEALGMGWTKGLHPDDREQVFSDWSRMVKSVGKWGQEYRFLTPAGKVTWVYGVAAPQRDASGRITHYVGVNLDITERKQAEEEKAALEGGLMQAQKMESVGRLASGVAHDFNNLLMGILSYVALGRDKLPAEHPVRGYLDEIASDAQRSAEITRQLLAFARKQTIAPKVLDLNETVTKTLNMLGRLLGENISLTWVPGTNLWPVKLDPAQVDQVLVNLCVNARDAIAGTGQLTIQTANIQVDGALAKRHAGALPRDYVLLTVNDNGSGMAQDVLAQVFEPFFTTKEVGKGTGLGLATVYGIVEQNNGFVTVDSELGKGTTFRLYLPRCLAEGAKATPEAPAERPRGNETVLLVEDEKSVRVTTHMFLEDLGYTVLVADHPEEALRLAARHAGEIALLITDVIMPGMSGSDMASRLQEDRPALKRLFISGFTADIIEQEGILDDSTQFLSKPFERDELARKVREILDGEEEPRRRESMRNGKA